MLKPADYTKWKRKTTWRLHEAVALMLGIEPHQKIQEGDQVYSDYWDMLDTARRSERKDLRTTGRTTVNNYVEIYASVEPAYFLKWAKGKGYEIPEELVDLLDSPEMQPESVEESEPLEKDAIPLNKTEQRLLAIKWVIHGLGYNPTAIPTGGKQIIKSACLKERNLFTDATFDNAWKVARRRELVKLLENDKFKPG